MEINDYIRRFVNKHWNIEYNHEDIEHFIDIRITDKFKEKHPALDRDMGPSILDFLLENGLNQNNTKESKKPHLNLKLLYLLLA